VAKTPEELREIGFEGYVEEHLLKSGYIKGNPDDYNKEFALDTKLLFEFLEDTQPKKMERLREIYKDQYQFKVLSRLNRELNNRGMIDVLRHGIKDYGVYLDLAYFKPASKLNTEMLELYEKNRISVTRQVHYSTKNENSIDMLICVNGLPVVVLELKNPFTGQTYEDAIMQYKKDRSPNELLFQFKKRAIVYFAVDTQEVYMTTRLAGSKTFFLPFNKGCDGGKGNPDNPDGFKTAYLWEEILQKDSLMDILKRFVFIETQEKKDIDGNTYTSETVIFPRYHQLDVVRKLEADAKKKGVGTNYLVQHSAGSGKTNSISWLAHRLANLHDDNDNPVFDSVIVITDRRVLDRQLQDSIYQLEHKHGVVQKIDKDSNQLADALKSGTRIIISTLQKFPFIIEKAKEFLNQEDIRLDDLISDMEYNRIKAREERQKVQKHLEDIEKLREELMYKENRLESERHRILQKAREEARRVLRQAKEEADDIIRELNKLAQESAARERNREIERHRRNLKLKLEELDRQLTPEEMYSRAGQISANDIRLGETVYVSTLNQKGQVLTLPDENETVMIQVGIMKVEAKLSDLRRTEENESFRNFQASGKKPSPRIESITPEMDLRGQTVDEALVSIDKYLDDAFLSGLREVTLIHGKGTGALRDGIHQYLRRHPHVNTFRLGKYGEGESGVTVVELK
jgi:F0F1-type ATP synthase membrane subunit b/b'